MINKQIESFLQESSNPLIVILGPTASGKTDLSIKLAQRFSGEIVSADSRQIYKYMDIGTSKIKDTERKGIAHYMIDIIDPGTEFSVYDYREMAISCIDKVKWKGRTPFLVGGTGLYIDTVIYNYSLSPCVVTGVRDKLEEEYKNKGAKYMYDKLRSLDPFAARKIHPNNYHHLIRALEVYISTGRSKFGQSKKDKSGYDLFLVGINIDRDNLYERINRRVENMFDDGLVEETKKLVGMGYSTNLSSMSSIGYKEIIAMLGGEISEQECLLLIQKKTRNYAKRQLTWFRKNKDIIWI